MHFGVKINIRSVYFPKHQLTWLSFLFILWETKKNLFSCKKYIKINSIKQQKKINIRLQN